VEKTIDIHPWLTLSSINRRLIYIHVLPCLQLTDDWHTSMFNLVFN
jgi:hypothetical protein